MTVASELDLLVELLASSVSEQALTFFGGKFTPFRWENRDSWAVGELQGCWACLETFWLSQWGVGHAGI